MASSDVRQLKAEVRPSVTTVENAENTCKTKLSEKKTSACTVKPVVLLSAQPVDCPSDRADPKGKLDAKEMQKSIAESKDGDGSINDLLPKLSGLRIDIKHVETSKESSSCESDSNKENKKPSKPVEYVALGRVKKSDPPQDYSLNHVQGSRCQKPGTQTNIKLDPHLFLDNYGNLPPANVLDQSVPEYLSHCDPCLIPEYTDLSFDLEAILNKPVDQQQENEIIGNLKTLGNNAFLDNEIDKWAAQLPADLPKDLLREISNGDLDFERFLAEQDSALDTYTSQSSPAESGVSAASPAPTMMSYSEPSSVEAMSPYSSTSADSPLSSCSGNSSPPADTSNIPAIPAGIPLTVEMIEDGTWEPPVIRGRGRPPKPKTDNGMPAKGRGAGDSKPKKQTSSNTKANQKKKKEASSANPATVVGVVVQSPAVTAVSTNANNNVLPQTYATSTAFNYNSNTGPVNGTLGYSFPISNRQSLIAPKNVYAANPVPLPNQQFNPTYRLTTVSQPQQVRPVATSIVAPANTIILQPQMIQTVPVQQTTTTAGFNINCQNKWIVTSGKK